MANENDINTKNTTQLRVSKLETTVSADADSTVAQPPKPHDAPTSRSANTSHRKTNIKYNKDGSLKPGTVVRERFVIKALLGSGGMGSVYRALDLRKHEAGDQDPYIAIKILSGDFQKHNAAFVTLQREAKKTQVLAHPNVVTVYDFDRDGELIFITMEELVGQPLSEYLKITSRDTLTVKHSYAIIDQIAKGLGYAHSKGIIHSDLKPANIFITEKGDVKILDFGIARAASEGLYQDTFDAGSLGAMTLAYASLEMMLSKPPHPSDDIYALGIIAYELLDGHHPYGRKDAKHVLEEQIKPKRLHIKNPFLRKVLSQSVAIERQHRIKNSSIFLRSFHRSKNAPRRIALISIIGCLAIGANAIYIQNIETQIVPFNELAQEQQQKFHQLISEGNRAVTFEDIQGAVIYYNDAYAIHQTHKDIKRSIRKILEVFDKNIENAETETERSFAVEQKKSLLEYPAFAPKVTD